MRSSRTPICVIQQSIVGQGILHRNTICPRGSTEFRIFPLALGLLPSAG